jgi:hypothetical protein
LKTQILQKAKERALAYKVKNVVVPCVTGYTVKAVVKEFGDGFNVFAVGNPTSSRDKGLVIHPGTSEETKKELEALGVTVILQEVSLFQANEEKNAGMDLWERYATSYERRTGRKIDPKLAVNFSNELLTFIFSDGPRVCIELALMAAESNLLPLDQDCISLAIPSRYCELPDAAVILKPSKLLDIFHEQFKIKDVLMVPSPGDWWMKQGKE